MNIDPGLLEACIREDRRAQSELYKRCFSVMMSICIRYTRQEADALALVNMGFLKVLQNLERRREKVPFEAWMRRIMINTVIDNFRKNKRYRETHQQTEFDGSTTYNSHTELNQAALKLDAEALEKMITRLPDMSRQVFNLYAIDGYTHKEIGKMLGISDGTSKWHVAFARKRLKKWLNETANVSKTWTT